MKHIYVASPYSSKDREFMYERAESAMKFIAYWYNNKPNEYVMISPIAYMAPAERAYGLPGTWEFWSKIDMSIIERSDELWVLMLPGVGSSIGVRAEIKYAQEIGKPVRCVWPEEGYLTTPLSAWNCRQCGWEWHGN